MKRKLKLFYVVIFSVSPALTTVGTGNDTDYYWLRLGRGTIGNEGECAKCVYSPFVCVGMCVCEYRNHGLYLPSKWSLIFAVGNVIYHIHAMLATTGIRYLLSFDWHEILIMLQLPSCQNCESCSETITHCVPDQPTLWLFIDSWNFVLLERASGRYARNRHYLDYYCARRCDSHRYTFVGNAIADFSKW